MHERQPDFWFPAKSYGWGWGLPVTWQGWLVVLVYFGLQFWGIRHFRAQRAVRELLIYLGVVTVLFVVVVYLKGERPAAWRWGGK